MAADKVARRIKFRLDDGSLIAESSLLGLDGNGVVCVRVDKSVVDKQLASEREFERLQRLLSHPDLPALNNGYDVRTVVMVLAACPARGEGGHVDHLLAASPQGPPTKKARLDSKPSLSMGGASLGSICETTNRLGREKDRDAMTNFPGPVGLDWVLKCREIIANVQKGLKGDGHWFMNRVDEKLVPDYYRVIKNPMW